MQPVYCQNSHYLVWMPVNFNGNLRQISGIHVILGFSRIYAYISMTSGKVIMFFFLFPHILVLVRE